jgi:peptidoglycan/LPS O-acetylase OafA/YrhL
METRVFRLRSRTTGIHHRVTTTLSRGRPHAPVVRKLGYRPDLDGIRGVAVLMVMVVHSAQFVGATTWAGGYFGVEMFFSLSGFLITTLLLEERASTGRLSFVQFYARRALRLFPALLFGVSVAGVCVWILGSNLRGMPFPQATMFVLTCIANWSEQSLGVFGHLWTLSVEEQYYLFWPVLLVAGLRAGVKRRHMAVMLVAAAGIVAILRVLVIHVHEPGNFIWGALRTDSIMIGSALALVLSLDDDRVRRVLNDPRVMWVSGGVLSAFLVYAEIASRARWPGYGKDLLPVGTIAFVLLMGGMIVRPASGPMTWAPIVEVGRLSYSVYLVHYGIFIVLARVATGHPLVRLAAAWTISFALALFSYHLIERPALRLKKRLAGRGTKPHTPDAERRDWDSAAAEELFDREGVGR